MPTPASGTISFTDIRDNFYNKTNVDGFYWGVSNTDLYSISYYRGKAYQAYSGGLPTGTAYFPAAPNPISFSDFYDKDGSGYDPGGGGGGG